jgi:hypothetical protein
VASEYHQRRRTASVSDLAVASDTVGIETDVGHPGPSTGLRTSRSAVNITNCSFHLVRQVI